MQDYKRKLAAIFSADVAGYSRLMGEDEIDTVKTLTLYREVMYSLIKQHRGRVVDSPGDNLLAEFASVVDAVQCGVAVQKEIQSRNTPFPENRKMYFRIGINLGDVIEEGERIYGDGVNIAARLEALADPGGICISKTAFDHIESKLPLGYEFIGEQTIKNISKPVYVYKVIMDPRVVTVSSIKKAMTKSFWTTRNIVITGLSVVALILLFSVAGIIPRCSDSRPVKSNDQTPSIVVLPFENRSGDPSQETFSDSITGELIHSLARIEGLRVVSRTSSFYYKKKSVSLPTLGNELGVTHVLEGSVRKDGNTLHVTVQLISVANDDHLLTENYEREMEDIFDIQIEISKAVAEKLKIEILGTEYESEEKPSIVKHERRMGINVVIDDDEIITGGLLVSGINIDMSGSVKGGLKAFGANVDIAGISQDMVDFWAINGTLSGIFKDKVKGSAEKLTVSGTFENDLKVDAKKITLTSTAVINGNFIYSGVLERKDGSYINGEIIEAKEISPETFSFKQITEGESSFQAIFVKIYWSVCIFILGIFAYFLFPKQTEKILSAISYDSFLKTIWKGFLFIITSVFIMVAAFFSFVGIPAGIIYICFFIIIIISSLVYGYLWSGRKLLNLVKAPFADNFFISLITGIIVIELLTLVPYVGWLAVTIPFLLSVSAMWQLIRAGLKTERAESQSES
ncbi:MAG: hypothetical protein JXL81_01610 [Deltaproteobacteria bacterium]|nr:hypothetical protein [Deltaproteobacteria bacterium]